MSKFCLVFKCHKCKFGSSYSLGIGEEVIVNEIICQYVCKNCGDSLYDSLDYIHFKECIVDCSGVREGGKIHQTFVVPKEKRWKIGNWTHMVLTVKRLKEETKRVEDLIGKQEEIFTNKEEENLRIKQLLTERQKLEVILEEEKRKNEQFVLEKKILEDRKKKQKLLSFLDEHELSCYFEKMKSSGVKYENLGIFLEHPETLGDFITMGFHRVLFLKSIEKEKKRGKGSNKEEEQRTRKKDSICGEYFWNEKNLKITKKNAFFDYEKYEVEKLASNVYKIEIKGVGYMFIWDDEDEMLRVVRTIGGEKFYERIKKKVFTKKME